MEKEIDLLFDDYTIVNWPTDKIHSRHFPYLVIRIGFGSFSILAIKKSIIIENGEKRFKVLFKKLARELNYTICTVLAEDFCYYFEPNGKVSMANQVLPTGGNIINWQKLQKGLIKVIGEGDKKIFYSVDENNNEKYHLIIPAI